MRERLIGGAGAVVYVIGMASASPLAATAGALVALAVLVLPLLESHPLPLGAVLVCAAAVLLPVLWLWLPAEEYAWFAYAPPRESSIPYFSDLLTRLAWLGALLLGASAAFIAVALRTPRPERRRKKATIVAVVLALTLLGEALLTFDADAFGAPAVVLAVAGLAAAGLLAVLNARRAPRPVLGVAGAYLLGRFALDVVQDAVSVAELTGFRPDESTFTIRTTAVAISTSSGFDVSAAIVAACAIAGLALLATALRATEVPESAP